MVHKGSQATEFSRKSVFGNPAILAACKRYEAFWRRSCISFGFCCLLRYELPEGGNRRWCLFPGQLRDARVTVVELAPPGTETALFRGATPRETKDSQPMDVTALVKRTALGGTFAAKGAL
jgi:hypothetical protein